MRKIINPIISQLGLATTLAVTGPKSGAEHTVPVNVLEHEGKRYLVAPRGETDWVRNLRANGHVEAGSAGASTTPHRSNLFDREVHGVVLGKIGVGGSAPPQPSAPPHRGGRTLTR